VVARIGELWLERVTPAAARHSARLLLELPGHAHMLMLEDGWEAFGHELEAWLARAVA
jgi:hypothetical protein